MCILVCLPVSSAPTVTVNGGYYEVKSSCLLFAVNIAMGTLGYNTVLGLRYDDSCSGSFSSLDFITPGGPVESFLLSVGSSTFVNQNAGSSPGIAMMSSSYLVTGSKAAVTWQGSNSAVEVTHSYRVDDGFPGTLFITTTVKAKIYMTGVVYARAVDPDSSAFSTTNRQGFSDANFHCSAARCVTATTVENYVVALFADKTPLSTGTGIVWSSNPRDYLSTASQTVTSDSEIGLGYNIGTLSAGASVSFRHVYVVATPSKIGKRLSRAFPTATIAVSPTVATASGTVSDSPTASTAFSLSETASSTISASLSSSQTVRATASGTVSDSPTASQTASSTVGTSHSATTTASAATSASPTTSTAFSLSETASPTVSTPLSSSQTVRVLATATATGTVSDSATTTASAATSASPTASTVFSLSETASSTVSTSLSSSQTVRVLATATASAPVGAGASVSSSTSASGTVGSSTLTSSPVLKLTVSSSLGSVGFLPQGSGSLSYSLFVSASQSLNISASESLSTMGSPSTVLTASPGTLKLTTTCTLSRKLTRHTSSPTPSAMRSLSQSGSTTQSASACDDVPWFVRLVEPYSTSRSSASRIITVGYDWFASNCSGALVMEIANLSPWRCVGAHLVIGGEKLAFEVADADIRVGGNATVRLSPSVNSTALLDSGNVVWPGVLRLPFVDQHVEIALEMSCRSFLFSAAVGLAVRGLPPPTISATAQSVVSGSQAVSMISGSPTSAATMARVSSAMSLTSCVKAMDNSAVSQSADKVRALIPIEFYNSSSPNDDLVNSLLANDVFIASFTAVVAVFGLAVSLFAGMSFQYVLLQLRWPSTLFPAFVATLPSVVGSVGAFVTRAVDGSTLQADDWAPCLLTCCSSVVVWFGFCVWVTVVCARGSSLMVSQEKSTKYLFVDQLLRCERTWVRSMLRVVFRSDWEWTARDHHHDSSGEFSAFIQANSSAFTELRVSWFTAFDVWTTLVSSVVNVVPLGTTVGCVSVAVSNVVIALMVCVVAFVIRPYGSRFGTVHLMLTQLGSLSCTCCVLAYILTAREEILNALSTVVIVIGALSMSRTVVDLVTLVQVAMRLRVVAVAHRHAAREKHSPERVEKHPEWSFGGLFDEFDEQLDEKRTLSEEYDTEGYFFHKEVSELCVNESMFWDSSGNVAPDVLRQGEDTFSILLDNWDEGTTTTTRIPGLGSQEAPLVISIDELDIDELLGIRRDVEVERVNVIAGHGSELSVAIPEIMPLDEMGIEVSDADMDCSGGDRDLSSTDGSYLVVSDVPLVVAPEELHSPPPPPPPPPSPPPSPPPLHRSADGEQCLESEEDAHAHGGELEATAVLEGSEKNSKPRPDGDDTSFLELLDSVMETVAVQQAPAAQPPRLTLLPLQRGVTANSSRYIVENRGHLPNAKARDERIMNFGYVSKAHQQATDSDSDFEL